MRCESEGALNRCDGRPVGLHAPAFDATQGLARQACGIRKVYLSPAP